MLSWLFTKPLAVNSVAPDFTLQDQDGVSVKLYTLRGRNVVLIFYPADETKICRKQLCEFRDANSFLTDRQVAVYGINPGSPESHGRFIAKNNLPFPLLVDKGQEVAKLYQANGWVIRRTVYLIGPDGVIRFAKRGKPNPAEVLSRADIPV